MISIIIPVYNTSRYLEKCVRSLQTQTYKDFTAIFVDDGSTDDSGQILDRLAASDSRLRVYHTENQGVSNARNFALDKVNTEFVTFLDSDDFYEPAFLEILINNYNASHADMIVTAYTFVYLDGKPCEVVDCGFEGMADADKALQLMLKPIGYRCYLYTKLLLNRIIQDNKIRLNKNLSMMEDMAFVVEYLKHCNKVAFVNMSSYNYVQRAQSAVHTPRPEAKRPAFEYIIPIIEESFGKKSLCAIRWTYYWDLLYIAKQTKNREYRKEILGKIAKERKFFFHEKKYSYLAYVKHVVEEMYLRLL